MAPARRRMFSVYEWATRYVATGLSVIPVRSDGTKAPILSRGLIQQYRDRLPDAGELHGWFVNTPHGIAVVGGPASGNLAVMDFESEGAWYRFLFQSYAEEIEHFFAGCPVIITPSGGRHLYCRIAEHWVAGGVLAKDSKGGVYIEVRGHGSYVLAPGSPNSCHKFNLPYLIDDAGWLKCQCAPMPVTHFERLCELARSLNEYVPPVRQYQPSSTVSNSTGTRPGDDFNRRASWAEILEPHGWKVEYASNGVTYWCRPGKDHGVSATSGHCSNDTSGDLLYVFSGNAQPLESERAYSKYTTHVLLNHRGDFKGSTRELYELSR